MEKAEPRTITTTLTDGTRTSVPVNTPVGAVLAAPADEHGLRYLGALVNNDVVSLTYPLEVDCDVTPLTVSHPQGVRIYRRSISFLVVKAVQELFPDARCMVEHSLGTGFFCAFEQSGNSGISRDKVDAIEKRMTELCEQDIPIERLKVSFEDAVARFKEQKQYDKYSLLRFMNPPKVVLFSTAGFSDLAHGVLAPTTGALNVFNLESHAEGFVIQFPDPDDPTQPATFQDQPHLFQIYQEHKEWGRILGISTVGTLNEVIANRGIGEFIKIAEALHEKKLAHMADQVHQRGDRVRTILIAGPSSAGKTTMAKRLSIQLRVNGLRPRSISVDDYFVDRKDTPRDEHGKLDFEHVESIDLELLNEDLKKLVAGEVINVPRFNFEKGAREYRGNQLQLAPGDILILEGIHCLNPRLSEAVPDENKFKIFVSALTQLNLDDSNRISTTDNRLIRRMVRDHKFRGHSALTTLQMWPSVQRGEERWIFPNQQTADATFNSALDYELAILKPMVSPLLAEVKPSSVEYANARRLQDFLSYFVNAPEDLVPSSSILREYIGGSSFTY